MNKMSYVKNCLLTSKRSLLPLLICGITALGAMTGCEKASERTIYITPLENKITSESGSLNFSGNIESIGSGKLLETMTFRFEGVEMCLNKKPYSDFKEKGWTFDPAAYGLENLVAEIGNVYQRSIYLDKEGFDSNVFCIGITNFQTNPCSIEDIQLWSVEFTAHGRSRYPEVIVNGGVTWGSKKEDIIKAYGEPDNSDRNDIDGSTVMHYTDNAGSDVYFEVYDNEGVGKITMDMYKL